MRTTDSNKTTCIEMGSYKYGNLERDKADISNHRGRFDILHCTTFGENKSESPTFLYTPKINSRWSKDLSVKKRNPKQKETLRRIYKCLYNLGVITGLSRDDIKGKNHERLI